MGFDVRESTGRKLKNGAIDYKYLLCSREGLKNVVECDRSTKKQRRVSTRVGCQARLIVKHDGLGGYYVKKFEERHNHCMYSHLSKPFLKVNRKLTAGHQMFVANCTQANLGPLKSYRLFKEMVGGYSNIGATSVDFKNLKRDLNAYISGGDAQLVIEKFFKKKEICSALYFNYDVDESQQLTRIFWADPIARKNFSLFGDVVSFDATYRTNRYNLVFVPFTGVDNHKKSVTFGAGLLSREDVPSYIWLLENFKKAMGNEPLYTVIDQYPAMKIAIDKVFRNSRHRFCMWHIMTKVSEKVGQTLAKNEDFRRKLNVIVWNEQMEATEFDSKWATVMTEYRLDDHNWFKALYELCSFWVPAYFRDLFMGGLLRTISRSESENSVFGGLTNPQSSLVEFMMHFDSAINAQWHTQARLNTNCEGYTPEFKTPLPLERHAAAIYTVAIFYEVQTEICAACFSCRVASVEQASDKTSYEVKDAANHTYTVEYSNGDNNTSCTCKMFQRLGLLCRHIFLVFKDLQLDTIPAKYVIGRWTKDAHQSPMFKIDAEVYSKGGDMEEANVISNQMWADFYTCVGLADGNVERISLLGRMVKDMKELFIEEIGTDSTLGKERLIQTFCGTKDGHAATVHSPKPAKNKGSGRRLKSAREKAMDATARPKRLCRKCNEYANHNSWNCPSSKNEQEQMPES